MTSDKKPKGSTYVTTKILEEHLNALHDDLKQNHFAPVLQLLETLMALTANEQAQLDRIGNAVDAIATETQGAAQKILDLMAQHNVDQATIDGMEADVVNALSPIADRAEALANDLKNPTTPLTPTP